MAPIGSRHAAAVNRISNILKLSVGTQAIVAIQNPVRLDRYSEPQPDIALLRPHADFYAAAHHGIPEVRLVDIDNNNFTIHREAQTAGDAQIQTLESLARIEAPGLAGVTVDSGGLW